MRIALTADPALPVPPENYGGIERVIHFLATGLADRGHDVLLVAHASSSINIPVLAYHSGGNSLANHFENALTINKLRKFKPNLIHSFSRLAYLLPFLRSPVPKIMSYQREPTLPAIIRTLKLARKDSLTFTGCSNYITDKIKPFGYAETVYNGVEMNKYHLNPEITGGPLIFLGRVEPSKGIKTAVNVAIAANRELIIAGNIPMEYAGYFDVEIKPYLSERIRYIGPVNDLQKNALLRMSSALLMPIAWNEPFGIVMVEAMACGTPVIGFDRGSVPEIITDGINGYKCHSENEMIELLGKIKDLDRSIVRKSAFDRFSSDLIIDEYLKVYEKAIFRCLKSPIAKL